VGNRDTEMTKYDLLVVGEINPDLILRGNDVQPLFGQAEKLIEQATLTIGSSSVIMACGAARLGLRVAFVGVVGDDEFGRFMLTSMAGRGIDTAGCVVDDRLATGMSVILSQPHDRAILTYPGAIPKLRREQISRSGQPNSDAGGQNGRGWRPGPKS
jgi:ribokinase